MVGYIVNSSLPIEEQKVLSKVKGDRAFLDFNNGIMCAYIVMNNIQEKEIELASSTMGVKSVFVNGVSFMRLDYGEFDFDIPILYQEKDAIKGNALNIFLVEENGYILRGIRTLGLSDDIMQHIGRCKETPFKSDPIEFQKRVAEIFSNYTTEALFFNGASQVFTR